MTWINSLSTYANYPPDLPKVMLLVNRLHIRQEFWGQGRGVDLMREVAGLDSLLDSGYRHVQVDYQVWSHQLRHCHLLTLIIQVPCCKWWKWELPSVKDIHTFLIFFSKKNSWIYTNIYLVISRYINASADIVPQISNKQKLIFLKRINFDAWRNWSHKPKKTSLWWHIISSWVWIMTTRHRKSKKSCISISHIIWLFWFVIIIRQGKRRKIE